MIRQRIGPQDNVRGISAVGSAPHSHCGGREFESHMLQYRRALKIKALFYSIHTLVKSFPSAQADPLVPEKYNMLNRAAGGRAPTRSESCGKGWCLYEEFMIILTAVNVIIAVLNYTHKK